MERLRVTLNKIIKELIAGILLGLIVVSLDVDLNRNSRNCAATLFHSAGNIMNFNSFIAESVGSFVRSGDSVAVNFPIIFSIAACSVTIGHG